MFWLQTLSRLNLVIPKLLTKSTLIGSSVQNHAYAFKKTSIQDYKNKSIQKTTMKQTSVSNLGNFNKLVVVVMSIEEGFLAKYLQPKQECNRDCHEW